MRTIVKGKNFREKNTGRCELPAFSGPRRFPQAGSGEEMKRKKDFKSAAASVAGNIVTSWLALNASPRDISKLNQFAKELDRALNVRLPGGALRGTMCGTECEIRQNALILLLDKYLAGNRQLLDATAATDIAEIANQIDRSIAAAIRICRRRLSRRRNAEAKRHEELLVEDPRLPYLQPASCTMLYQLPYALKHVLAMKLLQISVQTNQTSKAAAKTLMSLLGENITQAEMAEKLGVSPSAISQTVHTIAKKLQKLVKDIDLPHP